jgi:hypothetical protein
VAPPSPADHTSVRVSPGWPRAAGLLLVALVTSVAQPSVLVALPYLALGLILGVHRPRVMLVGMLAAIVAFVSLPQDGGWYLERGWALLVGGWFAALTLRRPHAPFSHRALGSVAGAALVSAVVLAIRSGAWQAVEWVVQDRMVRAISGFLDAARLMRGGKGLPPALVTTIYEAVDKQIAVFPAMLGLASVAALGVAWWAYVRLTTGNDQAVGPLRYFRFNDHLVWVFIGGVLLLVLRAGAFARVGANAVVFMGALYAVRGAAVILFMSGGLSFFGYVLLVFGMLFVPPLILTGALVVGIGDTWLDVRKRLGSTRA